MTVIPETALPDPSPVDGAATTASSRLKALHRLDLEPPSKTYTIQVGAFRGRENASRLQAKLSSLYDSVRADQMVLGGELFYRIRVGQADSRLRAESLRRHLVEAHHVEEAVIVALKRRRQEEETVWVKARTVSRLVPYQPDQSCEFLTGISGVGPVMPFSLSTDETQPWDVSAGIHPASDWFLSHNNPRQVRFELAGLSSGGVEAWLAAAGWAFLIPLAFASSLLVFCYRLTARKRSRLVRLAITRTRHVSGR